MKYEIYNTFAVGSSPYDVIAVCLFREDAEKVVEALGSRERLEAITAAIEGVENGCKPENPAKAKKAKRVMKPRACAKCGETFVPRGTRSTVCDKCIKGANDD